MVTHVHKKIVVRQLQARLKSVRQWRTSMHDSEAGLDDSRVTMAAEVTVVLGVGDAKVTYRAAIRRAGRIGRQVRDI